MSFLVQDLRHAIRRIVRAPGLVAVAVLSLGLGIGATSTVFSLIDAIVLRPWPIRDPASLLSLSTRTTGSRSEGFSYPEYLDLSAQTTAFAGLAADDQRGALLATNDETELLFVNVVSENYFSVLGIRAELGRTDFAPSSAGTVVISHDLWQRKFGSDPEIIGKTIRLTRTDVTVLGVTPPHFRGLEAYLACEVWIPRDTWAAMGNGREFLDRDTRRYRVIGRLADDLSLDRAQSQLDVVGSRLAAEYPATNRSTSYVVVTESSDRVARLKGLLVLSACIVTLVLVICCANVAGLLIVQAETRRREMAVRLSLGADRRRLFRQLLSESLLLAALGAALGLMLTAWLIRLLPAMLPPGPFSLDVRVETRVVVVTVVASLLATILAGLLPARGAARTDVHPVLKGAEPGLRYGRRRVSLRDALVVGQVMLSFVLLATAAILLRSFLATLSIDPGFNPGTPTLLVEIAPGFIQGAERRLAVHDDIQARLATLPGVTGVSYARRFHLSGSGGGATATVTVPGVPAPTGGETWAVKFNLIGPGYLRTVGTSLVRGRDFGPADRSDGQPVMLISETMAERFWPGADPIGRSLRVNDTDRFVVGIVRDAKIIRLHETAEPYFYVPYGQMSSGETTLIVQAADPVRLMPAVRRVIREAAPDLPIVGMLTLHDQMEAAVYDQKMPATLAGGLGALGMFLAAVGLYGAVAYTVSRRVRDIGIRIALGARPRSILGMVVGHGMRLAGVGVILGGGLALAVGRLLAGQVVGVDPANVLPFAGTASVVGAVTLAACYVPARRAARVDPIQALRSE